MEATNEEKDRAEVFSKRLDALANAQAQALERKMVENMDKSQEEKLEILKVSLKSFFVLASLMMM